MLDNGYSSPCSNSYVRRVLNSIPGNNLTLLNLQKAPWNNLLVKELYFYYTRSIFIKLGLCKEFKHTLRWSHLQRLFYINRYLLSVRALLSLCSSYSNCSWEKQESSLALLCPLQLLRLRFRYVSGEHFNLTST